MSNGGNTSVIQIAVPPKFKNDFINEAEEKGFTVSAYGKQILANRNNNHSPSQNVIQSLPQWLKYTLMIGVIILTLGFLELSMLIFWRIY